MFASVVYLGVHRVENAHDLQNMLRHNQMQKKRQEAKDKMNKLVNEEVSFEDVLHSKVNSNK